MLQRTADIPRTPLASYQGTPSDKSAPFPAGLLTLLPMPRSSNGGTWTSPLWGELGVKREQLLTFLECHKCQIWLKAFLWPKKLAEAPSQEGQKSTGSSRDQMKSLYRAGSSCPESCHSTETLIQRHKSQKKLP